jgi:hypothetical protein
MDARAKRNVTVSMTPVDGNSKMLLIVSMCGLAFGAMVAAAGVAKLFLQPAPPESWLLIGGGTLVAVAGIGGALHTLRFAPEPRDDCERYGRHIVGLTFLLLVIGLCNAVGTSTLAFDGGLGFSASALLEASDPKQLEKAEKTQQDAMVAADAAERGLAVARRAEQRTKEKLATACTLDPGDRDACDDAREQVTATEDDVFAKISALDVAKTGRARAQQTCDTARADCRRALFFLLSLSTMMSLFGASFYVVNRVRSKRPRKTEQSSPLDESTPFDTDPESASAGSAHATAIATGGSQNAPVIAVANAEPHAEKHAQAEPFDVHAFWSGGFFRVGEAVLFTFAFFWLIWTSDRRTDVIWLPVLGLFVGMFVKTGEAIIFRLGMRILSAVEALLPTAFPAPRAPAAPPQPSAPSTAPTPSTKLAPSPRE